MEALGRQSSKEIQDRGGVGFARGAKTQRAPVSQDDVRDLRLGDHRGPSCRLVSGANSVVPPYPRSALALMRPRSPLRSMKPKPELGLQGGRDEHPRHGRGQRSHRRKAPRAQAVHGPLDGHCSRHRKHDRIGDFLASCRHGGNGRPRFGPRLAVHRDRRHASRACLRDARARLPEDRRAVRLRAQGLRRFHRFPDRVELLDQRVGRERGNRHRLRRIPRCLLGRRRRRTG